MIRASSSRLRATILCACVACGCDRPSMEVTARVGSAARQPAPRQFEPLPRPDEAELAAARATTSAEAHTATEPTEPTEFVRVKARAGVLDAENYDAAIVTTPISANSSMKQQMIFDFQIPKALELFEQLRNRKPNSHQEFMREIIQKGNIRLPTLPPYYRYIYDPEAGDFFIERPANAN